MPPLPPDSSDSDITLSDTLAYLKDSGSDYLKAKAELAAIETKEAITHVSQKLSYGITIACFALFGYALLLATIIGAVSTWLEGKVEGLEKYVGTWPIVTFGLFLLHLLLVVIFLDKIKTKAHNACFAQTKAELKKDQLWLQQMKQNKEN